MVCCGWAQCLIHLSKFLEGLALPYPPETCERRSSTVATCREHRGVSQGAEGAARGTSQDDCAKKEGASCSRGYMEPTAVVGCSPWARSARTCAAVTSLNLSTAARTADASCGGAMG